MITVILRFLMCTSHQTLQQKNVAVSTVLVGHTNRRHLFEVTNLFVLRMYGWHTQTQMLTNAN